jgi:hypothetical protein
LETGEDESRNGFLNLIPQKSIDKSMLLATIVPPCSKVPRFWVHRSGLIKKQISETLNL